MLQEISGVRQVPSDYFRRWFGDDEMDLYIWYKADRTFHGFQLCYDTSDKAKALTWTEDDWFSHHGIDSGDESPLANRTPILVADGTFDAARVFARFRSSDECLPVEIRDFVRGKMEAYGKGC
jgi:hypothetical protein